MSFTTMIGGHKVYVADGCPGICNHTLPAFKENPMAMTAPPRRHKSTPAFEKLYHEVLTSEEHRKHGRSLSPARARYVAGAVAGQEALRKRRAANPDRGEVFAFAAGAAAVLIAGRALCHWATGVLSQNGYGVQTTITTPRGTIYGGG